MIMNVLWFALVCLTVQDDFTPLSVVEFPDIDEAQYLTIA